MDKKDSIDDTPDLLGEPRDARLSRVKGAPRKAAAPPPADPNPLCLSCRRSCKQEKSVLIASCPRYYAGPKLKREDWKQLSLLPKDDKKK